MDIGFHFGRHIIIDHMGNPVHIQAPGSHICSHQDIDITVFQPVDRPLPDILGNIPVKGLCLESFILKSFCHIKGSCFGFGKHDHPVKGGRLKNPNQGMGFFSTFDHPVLLIDGHKLCRVRFDYDFFGGYQIFLGNLPDGHWHGG